MPRLVLVALVLALASAATPAAAQYPQRPVTLLGGYPAGGMVDIVSRKLVDGMKSKFPRGLAVVTRPGAGGSVAMSEVVAARPDGYTLILTPNSPLVIQPQMNDLPYKTPDDYEAIMNIVSFYPLLAVRADAPWKTVQEFVAAAKASPGKLRVASPGEGTSSHLNLEETQRVAGFKVTHVPFAGWGESSVAILGGHVEAIVCQPGEARPQVEGKKLRVLTVFQAKRHRYFPDAPTAKELGWDVSNGVWFILAAPKGTPAPIVKYLHDATKAAIEDPSFVEAMQARGVDVDYRPGEQLRSDLRQSYQRHAEILRRLGMLKK
ncbi:MAG TPA: tripartite tricarboxylate transporter substrate binding protein [Methylomirabilota bacterium]|nr:tripartite tricarboxylate transporter substrate binding protein [Methylomirabilota bacterium]